MEKAIFIVLIGILFISCSSLSFIPTPPTMTVATTDYVDKAVLQQTTKSRKVILEETKKALSEVLDKERARIDSLETIVKRHGDLLKVTSSRLKEIVLINEQLKMADTKLSKNLQSFTDSLRLINNKLTKIMEDNAAVMENIQKLRQEYKNLSRQTLKELVDAINKYYEATE